MRDDLSALRTVSAALGADPLQVQGPGGNTSIKYAGTMWIKASGTRLADAMDNEIFVAVDHTGLDRAVRAGQPSAERVLDWRIGDSPLRPSIETGVHAVMRWPVVLHTHCVATIAAAVRDDGGRFASEALAGLSARFIPYVKPGIPLANAIIDAGADTSPVLVLGNHGLVIGGETVDQAHARLEAVRDRLDALAPPALDDTGKMQAAPAGWQWLAHPGLQRAARTFTRTLARGALYPDHVVFLGPGVALAAPAQDPQTAIAAAGLDGAAPALVLVEGMGALLPVDASDNQHTMARCLGDVVARLDPSVPLRTLSGDEQIALINWEAETWRQNVEAGRKT